MLKVAIALPLWRCHHVSNVEQLSQQVWAKGIIGKLSIVYNPEFGSMKQKYSGNLKKTFLTRD